MHNQLRKNALRKKRAMRVRKKVRGTSVKPRLSVWRGNKHVSVQLIDDEAGVTIASVGTLDRDLRDTEFNRKNVASAKKIGQLLAESAKEKGVDRVVLDRGPNKYHGVVAAVAEGAREGGLNF